MLTPSLYHTADYEDKKINQGLTPEGEQMGKNVNRRGKSSHRGDIKQDRSEHWKHGKSSGNGMYSNRIAMKKARRHKKPQGNK